MRTALALTVSCVCAAILPPAAAGERWKGVLIRLEAGQSLNLDIVKPGRPLKLNSTSEGLLVWRDGLTEAWQYIAPGGSWSPPQNSPGSAPTIQIDQLLGSCVSFDQAPLAASLVVDERRGRALAKLHRGVILAQSGMATANDADTLFRQAMRELKTSGTPADRLSACNHAGNFLLQQAQDRLYNHAFQMAAGGRQPLLNALISWRNAASVFERALAQASDTDGARQRAGVLANQARLYALLADIIHTLDAEAPDGARLFRAGEQAATQMAAAKAREAVADEAGDAGLLIRAAAHEIQAHLAYRAREANKCLEHAQRALELYGDAGSMAGAEGAHRLLGMCHLRSTEFALDGKADPKAPQRALSHFLSSMRLADDLRSRIPPDKLGLAHAGFFARRAYVNEQVVDLLAADGRAAESLHYAEQAKARSLRERLAIEPTETPETRGDSSRTTAQLLDDWPAGVAAIEYFLGTEKAWLFVVDTSGTVQAWDLLAEGRRKRTSRDLVAEVRRFLSGVEGQAVRMRQDLEDGKGFDDAWQNQLHAFAQTLMPEGVLAELRRAKTVVVVPHHILHYFPFTALVTAPDTKGHATTQVVQPRFLIDENFDLIHAPSLLVWDRLRRRAGGVVKQVNAVGLADFPGARELPGVEHDVQGLQAAFGATIQQVLLDEQATETKVQELLGRRGMLLFATHGSHRADHPLESYLLCSQDQRHDGRLTAGELFSADIRADLVVISACSSGLAENSPLPGDDLFGIQRAFLQSGARTVVSGLWDVYDGTGPELMGTFFRNLARGNPAPTALAESQRAFLKQHRASDDPWGHPYFWAVYTVAGDDRTRIEN